MSGKQLQFWAGRRLTADVQHRKFACDSSEHACQQCRRANTWCTVTDNLSGIPAYRGQHEYLERRVEKQHLEIQKLVHQIRSLGQEVINPDSEDSESIRYTAWRHALSIDSKRPWEIEDANANHTVHLVLQAESHTNRSSQAFSGLVSSPDNSLRKKVLSASDYPVPWSGPYHSSSMSPALSQSPSTLASIPHCRDGYEVDNLASHNQTPPVGLTQEAPTSSRSRRLCACNIAGSGLRTMQNTLDSFHLRPHTDNVISHAYDPDSSNWYPYTGGMGNTNDIYNQSYLNHNMQEPSRR